MLLLYHFYFIGGVSFWRRIALILPFFLITLLNGGFFLVSTKSSSDIGFTVPTSVTQYFSTQLSVILTYLRLIILPLQQNLDYSYPITDSLFAWATIVPLLFHTLLLLYALVCRKKHPLLSFGIVWFYVTLSPTSSVVPVIDVIFEHRVYLPGIGIIWCLVILGERWIRLLPEAKRMTASALLVTVSLSCMSLATYKRNQVWTSRLALWQDCVSKSPNKSRTHVNLGNALYRKKMYRESIEEYNKALLCPMEALAMKEKCLNEIGVGYFSLGLLNEAVETFQQGLKNNPDNYQLLNNLAIAMMEQNKDEEALHYAQRALTNEAGDGEIYNTLGEIYCQKGNYVQAFGFFEKAIACNPDVAVRYWNAAVSLEQLGKNKEAYPYWQEYLEIEEEEESRQTVIRHLEVLKKR
jgi:tetratricopeptide (TPR) repeat protein